MLYLSGVVESAGRCAMIAYADIRMTLAVLFHLLVEHPEHRRALTCVCARESRGDDCDTHCGVGHKEMVFDSIVTACTQQWFHLFCQHVTHSQRIHLDQVGEHSSHLTQQVFVILLHLLSEMLAGQ